MSKYDYINKELAKFREEEDRPEWRIRKSAATLGNTRRKGNQKTGALLIEITSGEIGLWLDLKSKFKLSTLHSTKSIVRNRRLLNFTTDGSYEVMTHPSDIGLCFMYLKEYKRFINRNGEIPTPLFEYPQYKEIKSGIIGDAGYIKKFFPKFTLHYLDVKYEKGTKNKRNAFEDGVEFVSISVKVGTRKYKIVDKPTKNIKHKDGKRPHTGKAFYQIDKKGKIVNTWNTVKECHDATGLSLGGISNVLNGWAKSSGGFTFKHIKN